jgi:signal transduction histidine kinase
MRGFDQRTLTCLLTTLGWVALLSPLRNTDVSAAEPHRVLLLQAFGHRFSPWSDEAESFRTALSQAGLGPLDLIEVSLETDRVQDPRDEGPFVDYIRALVSGRRLDLIVPVGAPSALFMQRHRSSLFPSTPMLIVGADASRISRSSLAMMDTAVLWQIDLAIHIENILRLLPNTTEIAIVVGNSPIERFWTGELRRELQALAARVHFTYFNDLTFAEMLRRAAAMPPRSAIFWAMLTEDAAGVPHSEDQALAAMREVANAPVFGLCDYQLGRGIVGGPLFQTQVEGREAAMVAGRILKGEIPGDINPILMPAGAPQYDWHELQRWNIPEELLPRDSVVRFREPSVWYRYRWQLLWALALILLETVLIVRLLHERSRRRNAEIEAHTRLSELAHLNRRSAIGELSASIAHEIQQPLTAILSNAEAAESLLTGIPQAGNIRQILTDIRRDDLRASEVMKRVRRMLAKAAVETQEFDLNEVVSEVFNFLAAQAYANRLTLDKSLALTGPRVSGDRIQIQQVILNLVMNAMDAIVTTNPSERKIIGRTVVVADSSAEISIEDSGPGIQAGKADQVFEPFFTTKEGGMGMGLSIARTIVETHGGRIWAENHRGGAVFRIILPLARRGASVPDRLEVGKHAVKTESQMSP